jgi:hypothetical protein
MKWMRGPSIIDQKRLARSHAEAVLEELERVEAGANKELQALAVAVRQAHATKAVSTRNSLLQQSRAKRQQASLVARKKKAIQQHLDALQASELNEQVLSSVQETASVLKNMGLDKAVDQMDSAMADLQDSAVDIGTMQDALATSLALPGAPDDDDLQAELDMLLSDDTVLAPLPGARPAPAAVAAVAPPASAPAPASTEEVAEQEPVAVNAM